MRLLDGLNILVGPFGALLLVAVDHARSHSADSTQRNIMFGLAGSAILAIICELINDAYTGLPGQSAWLINYIACFLFFVFQQMAFSAIPLFLDYYIVRDAGRSRTLMFILAALSAGNLLALLLNIGTGYYFQISPDNVYHRGYMHGVRIAFIYSPAIVMLVELLLCRDKIRPEHVLPGMLLTLPAGVGGMLDLLFSGVRMLWPCYSLSLLFAYLFIVRAGYDRDALTGAHSRRKCNEFLCELARSTMRKPYAFLMVDMDDFKQINDRFGHAQGDRALRDVADILKNAVRERDFVARYGGDEFLLIVENCGGVWELQERILCDIANFNAAGTRPYVLKLSVGGAVYQPENTDSPEES